MTSYLIFSSTLHTELSRGQIILESNAILFTKYIKDLLLPKSWKRTIKLLFKTCSGISQRNGATK